MQCRACALVAGAWTEREKMYHGGSFLKLADDNMDIQNPEAQNRELSGFWEKVIFLPFPHEKTTFQWPKVVSEAIFPTNRGYICIEKWSQIFVSGIGSALTESEEKSLFQLKKWNMASETTFGHWKVVFSWGKGRKMTFSQKPLNSRFWASGFWMSILSSANFKKDPPWYIFFLSVHAPATCGLKPDA